MKEKGLLVVISGFSGVGKGTVIKLVLESLPNLNFSVSCTTRKPRVGEKHGKNYYFLTRDEFEYQISEDAFIEYTQTFTNYYGTLKSEIDVPIAKGTDMLLELNVVGAENIKDLYPNCITVFVKPPSIEELKQRLIGRGSEDAKSLERRLSEIDFETSCIKCYDYVVTNEIVEDCANEIINIINNEKKKLNA